MHLLQLVTLKYPFGLPTIALIAGIVTARWLEFSPASLTVALFIFIAGLAILRSLRLVALVFACFCLGALLYTQRYAIRSDADLRLRLGEREALATVRGELLEMPVEREALWGGRTNVTSSAAVALREIYLDGRWQPADGIVQAILRDKHPPSFFTGVHIEAEGVIRPPPRASAPGLFDYRSHLFNKRIFYVFDTESISDWRVRAGGATELPVGEKFRGWARRQLERGLRDGQTLDLLLSMTLGWKTALNGEIGEIFMRTGTMHIFAISGLHVACIAGFLVGAAQFVFAVPRQYSGLFVLPVIWFYTLATGWQTSAVRAALMSTVVIAGWILKKPSALLNSTAAAAFLICTAGFAPESIFQPGFQLSFVVVASIALLMPPLIEQSKLLYRPDPYLPSGLRSQWVQRLDTPRRWLYSSLAVSIASWIGSLPIIAWYFNLVTPVTLLANLVAVPTSSGALAFCVLSLLLPPIAPVTNILASLLMDVTVWFTELCATIPWGYFYVPKPSFLFFVFYYVLLFAGAAGLLFRPGRRTLTITLVALLGGVTAADAWRNRSPLKITMLLADGTPVWVDEPGGARDLLLDCSSQRGAEYHVIRFLRAQGVSTVRNIVLSHGDISNVGGFGVFRDAMSPRNIYTSPARSRSPIYRKIIADLDKTRDRQIISAGQEIVGWTVLHPPDDRGFPRADDNALVLYRDVEGIRILLLSDLGNEGQEQLLERNPSLRADIVFVGMPERGEPLADRLAAQLRPQVVVVGTTRYPVNSRLRETLRKRLEGQIPNVIYTSESGAVTCELKGGRAIVTGTFGHSPAILRPDQR